MWRLFTSVDFAVLQIIFLAVLAVIGMTIRQVPDFAFRSATDYAAAIEDLHARYDPLLGAGAVDALDRLSVFTIFRSPWFSAGLVVLIVSIIVCTLDRTPRLWRGVSDVRVAQPEPYFDPILPDRAAMDGVAPGDVGTVLRRNGFRVREAAAEDGSAFLYGDRHQYTKMATLLTHLGLILFLVAAAVTSRLGRGAGPRRGRGRVPDRPADRDARPAARQEPRLRGARSRQRARPPTSRPTWPSTRTAARSRARRSGSTTRCPSAATRSTRTGSARRRIWSCATAPAPCCGTRPCR